MLCINCIKGECLKFEILRNEKDEIIMFFTEFDQQGVSLNADNS